MRTPIADQTPPMLDVIGATHCLAIIYANFSQAKPVKISWLTDFIKNEEISSYQSSSATYSHTLIHQIMMVFDYIELTALYKHI